jgi:hypothetical protein
LGSGAGEGEGAAAQVVAPAELAVPGAQAAQLNEDEAPVEFENVLRLHGVQAAVYPPEKVPAGQLEQTVPLRKVPGKVQYEGS